MIREVNLIDYLPTMMKEYKELSAIMAAENPEIQLVENESEVVKNNQFIETCDENGIKRFEKMLKIVPNADDNLDARISRVITRWNDSIPYTYRDLIQKLDMLCGKGNYQIIPSFNDYTLELFVYLPLSGQVDELEFMFSYMIPSNIVVISNNVIPFESAGTAFLASTTVKTLKFTITSDLQVEYESNGFIKHGSTLIKTIECVIQ